MLDIIISFAAGFAAAAFGSMGAGGGATIGFLALLYLGLPVPAAIGTNKFGDVGLHPLNIYAFYKAGRINTRLLAILVPIAVVGSAGGALIVFAIDSRTIELAVAVLLILVFLLLLVRPDMGIRRMRKTGWWAPMYLLSEVYAGFFGAASGVFATVALMMRGLRIGEAAATMFAAGFLGAIISAIIFIAGGLVDYRLGMALFAGNLFGGWTGARIAIRKGDGWVRNVVLIAIAVTVIKLLAF